MSEPASSPGDLLRQAREAQGLDIDALAAMIKVVPAKLEALESGRHDQLPDANFTRALAMTVCRVLKIDPAPVLAGMPAAKAIPLGPNKPAINQPFKESRGVNLSFGADRSVDLKVLLRPQYLAPILLLLASVLVYVWPESTSWPRWLSSDKAISLPATGPAAPAPASSEVIVQVQPTITPPEPASGASGASRASAPAVPLVSQAPAASMPALADPAASGVVSAASAVNSDRSAPAGDGALVLNSREPSWVEVKDGRGQKLLSRQLAAGETVQLQGTRPFQLLVGNAPAIQLTLQGQSVDLSSYTRGKVARFELK